MTIVAGIDVGSTYTKAVLTDEHGTRLSHALRPTGFRLGEVADKTFAECLDIAGLSRADVNYVVATGYGRHQVAFRDVHVTDLTAAARGTLRYFPATRTVLDVGGQTMKASRLDADGKVRSFRLNDKCAAGTGAFLEKTARYMGYDTPEIAALLGTSKEPVPISGVCAVFAESEVINHLSLGTAPADIMQGAIQSLVGRAVQLLKRVRAEPEYTLIGGILRFPTMARAVQEKLGKPVNVPGAGGDGENMQFISAEGAAVLGHKRLAKLRAEGTRPGERAQVHA